MMNKTVLLVAVLLCSAQAVCGQGRDLDIFESCVETCRAKSCSQPTGDLVASVAGFFVARETPYVAHTLEISDAESLVVNLREMDCTTFVENCIAIAEVIKSGQASFKNYRDALTALRYRNGKINGYASRLHYTSDWIYENRVRLTDMSKAMGGAKMTGTIDFMSTHSQSYKHLKNNPANVALIKKTEDAINLRNIGDNARYIVPVAQIQACEKEICDGDIIAFATAVEGLDYSHLGIACRKNGKLHFIHASSKEKRVTFERQTLQEYCRNSEKCTGISVLRVN